MKDLFAIIVATVTVAAALMIGQALVNASFATRTAPGYVPVDMCPNLKGKQTIYDLNRTWVFKNRPTGEAGCRRVNLSR